MSRAESRRFPRISRVFPPSPPSSRPIPHFSNILSPHNGIPDQRVSAQDFIDLVREKDGFCVSCHPFRSNNRGLREHLRDVHGLDGVEVLNGSTPLEENRTALRFCRELGLKAIGASDAHVPGQVGKYVTWLPETVTTLPDFVTALHTLETRPAIWTGSGYDVVTEF